MIARFLSDLSGIAVGHITVVLLTAGLVTVFAPTFISLLELALIEFEVVKARATQDTEALAKALDRSLSVKTRGAPWIIILGVLIIGAALL